MRFLCGHFRELGLISISSVRRGPRVVMAVGISHPELELVFDGEKALAAEHANWKQGTHGSRETIEL